MAVAGEDLLTSKDETRTLLEVAENVARMAHHSAMQLQVAVDLMANTLTLLGTRTDTLKEFSRLADLARESTWKPEAATGEIAEMLSEMLPWFSSTLHQPNDGHDGADL